MTTEPGKKKDLKMQISATFVWIGFVAAISFMEAWLKFRAPGVTLPIGLSIGKLVFGALNKVEITIALVILVGILFERNLVSSRNIFYWLPVILLLLQSVWLLPILSERIDTIVSGKIPTPSNNHFYYIVMEVIKLISLLIFGFKLLSQMEGKKIKNKEAVIS